jgi:hypothetical protein
MTFRDRKSVVWDFGGPGTADLALTDDAHISVVRIWPDAAWNDGQTEAAIMASATARFGSEVVTHLEIYSGYLPALWAPEDTSQFCPPQGAFGVPKDLSIGDDGTYVRVPCGQYEITTCEWQNDNFDVTKLECDEFVIRPDPAVERTRFPASLNFATLAVARALCNRHQT